MSPTTLLTVVLAFPLLSIMETCGSSSSSIPQLLLATILNDGPMKSCELIFFTIKENLATNAGKTMIEIHPGILPNYNIMESSSGMFTLSVDVENSTTDIKYSRLKDIHKLNSKHCGVAVLHVSQVTPTLPEWLSQTIIPRYVPIIRKDEDHFVFFFNTETASHEMLISPEFGNRIKFKVGIVCDLRRESSEQLLIKQVDLYSEQQKTIINTLTELPSSGVKSLFIDRQNLNGKVFRVVTPRAPSYFEMAAEPHAKTYRPVRGLYKVWLDVMMETFNFTIHLTMSSSSGSTGKRLKNGTWVGSVGDILAGRADMASFNGHIYNRHEYVDWSAPITYEWLVFVTHKPQTFFSPSALYRPFPAIMWLGILVSILIICGMMKFMSKIADPTAPTLSFRDIVSYMGASFMEEGAEMYLEDVLHLSIVRVLAATWLLFVLVISTAYRGKLVSLIAFPALTWVPTSFDELAYSDYQVGLNVFGKGGATYSVLSTSKNPVYQTFFQKMELYPDPVKCLKAAFQNDLGCLIVKSVADFYGAKNFTDNFGRNPFQTSAQTALFREDGYIWEKRAVFRHHFDKVTWSMMEAGLTNLWFHQDLDIVKKRRLEWERLNPKRKSKLKISSDKDGPSKLQMAHLIGLFYLCFGMYAAGSIFLIWELLKNWKYKRTVQKLP